MPFEPTVQDRKITLNIRVGYQSRADKPVLPRAIKSSEKVTQCRPMGYVPRHYIAARLAASR